MNRSDPNSLHEGDVIFGPGSVLEADFDEMMWQIVDAAGADPYFTTGPSTLNVIDDTPSGWLAWEGWLTDPWTANLFYFGHGDPNGVGPTASLGLSEKDIGDALGNGYPWGLPFYFRAAHPYRFVFLDGCNTARAGLCLAFGIVMKRTDESYYTASGIQPQAFMGWNNTIQYSVAHTQFDSHLYTFDVDFFYYWSNQGKSLKDAVNLSRTIESTNFVPMPGIWGYDQLKWNP